MTPEEFAIELLAACEYSTHKNVEKLIRNRDQKREFALVEALKEIQRYSIRSRDPLKTLRLKEIYELATTTLKALGYND